jgi:hypothetical protein
MPSHIHAVWHPQNPQTIHARLQSLTDCRRMPNPAPYITHEQHKHHKHVSPCHHTSMSAAMQSCILSIHRPYMQRQSHSHTVDACQAQYHASHTSITNTTNTSVHAMQSCILSIHRDHTCKDRVTHTLSTHARPSTMHHTQATQTRQSMPSQDCILSIHRP